MADLPVDVGLPRVASTPVFVATFALVLGIIAVLLSFDLFLARVDRQESAAHAASAYQDGVALMRSGRAAEAADLFSTAVASERSNVQYSLALGEALLAQNETADAEAILRALLDRVENDGAVNLAMARVMMQEKKTADAKSYFHRAIFGHWGADSVAQRSAARFELIELLASLRQQPALLAELLPLQDVPDDSVALRQRLGQLFLIAGSPARAVIMFRDVLRHNPQNGDAYAGMGEAALALGNFRTARADLAEAQRLKPDDPLLARRLAVADTLLALDPSARGIGIHERYLRGRKVLERTIAAVAGCGIRAPALADSAARLLARPVRSNREEQMGDALLSMSSDIWDSRIPLCTTSTSDEITALLHTRVDR